MIHAIHVIESFAAGGIETTFLNVVKAWGSRPAWAVHHVVALAGGPLEGAYRDACESVTIAADQDDLERATSRPHDVLYILFDRTAYRLAPWLLGQSSAAVVYGKGYDMGGMFRSDAGLEWQADESLMWGADATTFTTQHLMSAFQVPAGRGVVLGKAADVKRFMNIRPTDRSTPPRIVCVANLHARKRLGNLIVAAAALRADVPALRVRFVGADDTGEGDRLRALAGRLDVADACEIVGRRDDVGQDLSDAAVFALPSGCEGVPTAMLEAMAAARPVVVTDVGHVRSAIDDGVEGFLVAPGDTPALVSRLRTILTDTRLAVRMGAAGRARACAHATEAVAARLRSTLETAARGPAA